MFRRSAAAAALTVAGLAVAAPMASATETAPPAHPRADGPVPSNSGNVTVLPVQACGLGVPILSGILDSPHGDCSVSP